MRKQHRKSNRRGAVTVELAFIAPVFIALLIGIWQATALHNVQNQYQIAAREGARMATLDRDDIIQGDETANEAITRLIKSFLNANQMPGDISNVYIVDAHDADVDFDLDDPANDMKYFRIIVDVNCVECLPVPPIGLGSNFRIGADVVFRNGRAEVIE